MRRPSTCNAAPLLALLLSAAAAFAPSASRADSDPFEENRRRLRQEKAEEQARIRRREEEAKRRIEQGRAQGILELDEVVPFVQRCRDALSFATRTAKAWSELRSKTVPPELMSQGKQYRSRVAAIEKSYQDCGNMIRSPTHVVDDARRQIATLKMNAESVARDGDRFCHSVLGLYMVEGRELLRAADDDLNAAADTVSRIQDALHAMKIRDQKAANERARKKVAIKLGRTERPSESEAETARRRKREYEEDQKIAQAAWDAEEARQRLEKSLAELERSQSDLFRRRKQCESRLASAASPDPYRDSSSDSAVSWDDALRDVQKELDTIETLKADVAAFCAAAAELESNVSPLAKEDAKPDVPGPAEKPTAKAKEPKRPASRSPVISWSPWDEAAPSGAKSSK